MLPKFIMWNIWIKCNQQIFNDKSQGPAQIVIKIQVLMGKTLRESHLPKNNIELSIEESNYLHKFNITSIDEAKARRPLEV